MDFKDKVMEKVEELSEQQYGCSYDELSDIEKDLIYQAAEEEVSDDLANEADLLVDIHKENGG